jgi:hypothetical protein
MCREIPAFAFPHRNPNSEALSYHFFTYLPKNYKMCRYGKFYFIMILFMNDAVVNIELTVLLSILLRDNCEILHPGFDQVTTHCFYMNAAHFINHTVELGELVAAQKEFSSPSLNFLSKKLR